jgi:hypothetical protein
MESRRLGQQSQLSRGRQRRKTEDVTQQIEQRSACSTSIAYSSLAIALSHLVYAYESMQCTHGQSQQEEVARETNLGRVEPSAQGLHALILPCN